MAGVISLGSINADFQLRLPSGLSGTTLAKDFIRVSGGKAANVAVFARRTGLDAVLVGCVGNDELATQALRGPVESGAQLRVSYSPKSHTGVAVITVKPDGNKTIVIALGANDDWPHPWSDIQDPIANAEPGSVLVVDLEMSMSIAKAAIQHARRAGLRIILDPSPADRVDRSLLKQVDYLTPNPEEASNLSGIEVTSERDAVEAVRALKDTGVNNPYVKLPDGGCALIDEEGREVVVQAPSDVQVIDLTGAGDAFAGGLAWGLLQGFTAEKAAKAAVAASTCAAGVYGSQASYPTSRALEEMSDRVGVHNYRG